LLFATNVAAIIATGTAVLLAYRVRVVVKAAGRPVGRLTGRTVVAVAVPVLLVMVPLSFGSILVAMQSIVESLATPVAQEWAAAQGGQVTEVSVSDGVLHLIAVGPPPEADSRTLREALDEAGLEQVDAEVTLVLGGTRRLPADG
jgi:hypothetical protein